MVVCACVLSLPAPGAGASEGDARARSVRNGARPRSASLRRSRPPLAGVDERALEALATSAAGFYPQEVRVNSIVPGTQSETTVAVFGRNVVTGYNQENGNLWSGVAYSTDGGVSFTATGGLPTGNSTAILGGDPSLTVCGDGTFYYASLYYPNATDSGLSVSVGTFTGGSLAWSNPKVALVSIPDFLDKEWITCDPATNTLYLIYVRFVDYNVTRAVLPDRVEIMKSTDGATTWSAPLVLESSSTEAFEMPYVVVGPGGEVYTLWEHGLDDIFAPNVQIEFRRSLDHAASFESKVVIRTLIPAFYPANVGYSRESTADLGTLAVDTSSGPYRGNLYAIWVEFEPGQRLNRDVFLSRSSDRGATWSPPLRVNDDPPGSDHVMPGVSVNGAGTIETIWYDYRSWPGMSRFNLYAARSSDGGVHFGPNFRVTTFPSSVFVPWTFTPNFGDYNQCVSVGLDFYPVWADTRNVDIDVFASHIPTGTCGNGILDPFEECDDGNTLDGDSCTGACAVKHCGNGIVDPGENCDDGNTVSGDGCSETCIRERCGDFVVQRTLNEECDDGNTVSGDGCSSACLIETDKMAWIALSHSWLVLESIVTGRVIVIGDPGIHEWADLTFDPSGRLFGASAFDSFLAIGYSGSLFAVGTLGLPDRGAPIGPSGAFTMQAIDFQPSTGVLYGIAVDAAGASRLVTLNPATGAILSDIGDLGLNTARAMAFDAGGALYVSAGNDLDLVNPATAAKTHVGNLRPTMVLSGMDFSPDGRLIGVVEYGTGADGGLVAVDKNTAAVTILSTGGYYAQEGIRFAPAIALDKDLDGVHDILDCAPLDPTNAPPPPISGLRFTDAASGTFTWAAAMSALHSNVYRGTITGLLGSRPPASVFDQSCFESGDAQGNGDLVSADLSAPPAGTAWYYVTDGESACGEGALDSDPAHPIPNASPCPTPP